MSDLVAALVGLNKEQRDAVIHDGNTAVLAGPGSGKTSTLVVKVARLLVGNVCPPRSVACLTYNNDAVEELRKRFADFGFYDSRRLFLGSVHSFCLNCIVRPYGPVVDPTIAARLGVASQRVAEGMLETAANDVGPNIYHAGYSATMTRYRRALACGEDVAGFDDRDADVRARYQELLAKLGVIDFEEMVLRSVDLVTRNAWIRKLLASRFPWIAVDEYQDLGGPLHKIVTSLVDLAGVKAFVVGDSDQTIYDFTGADPRYLQELADREDFTAIPLRLNYRSGRNLIAAGQAALASETGTRDYEAHPERTDHGQVLFREADDSIEAHAGETVAAIREAVVAGFALHEIVVLYRQHREVLPEVCAALTAANISFIAERETRYPRTPFFRWMQAAAAWGVLERTARESDFGSLARTYEGLLVEAGLAGQERGDLATRATLYSVLRNSDPAVRLNHWLLSAAKRLQLREILARTRGRSKDDHEHFEKMLVDTGDEGPLVLHTLQDFAEDGRARGKVVVTTLHSCKGRQFDVVILPGMVEGIMPPRRWNPKLRIMEEPAPKTLAESRRLFYVGFTRARFAVYLIHSKGYRNAKGYLNSWGPSRFVSDIERRLRA